MTTTADQRCKNGVACVEVIARVEAAHKIERQGCDDDHADELLATARRIAAIHDYGQAGLSALSPEYQSSGEEDQ